MATFTAVVQSSLSAHRLQVDQALARRGTDLPSFIKAGQQQGKSMEEIWMDLRHMTGVSFAVRTLYRWVGDLEPEEAVS